MFGNLKYSAIYLPNVFSISYIEKNKEFICSCKEVIEATDGVFALVSLKIEDVPYKENVYFATPIIRSISTRSKARLLGLSAAFRTMLVKVLSVQAGKSLMSMEDDRTMGYEIHLPRLTVPEEKGETNKSIIEYVKSDMEELIVQGINVMWKKDINV